MDMNTRTKRIIKVLEKIIPAPLQSVIITKENVEKIEKVL